MAGYLANKNKKEIHDLENEKAGCKIKKIKLKHQEPLQTIEEVEIWIKKFGFKEKGGTSSRLYHWTLVLEET